MTKNQSTDNILSYREMCEAENVQTLQRGMNYRLNNSYSVLLMSQRENAPYADNILSDGVTVLYEGHDEPRSNEYPDPKKIDQPFRTQKGSLTQNGKFYEAALGFKTKTRNAELVKIYEKILPGIWSLKGLFELVDSEIVVRQNRNVFVFTLKLSEVYLSGSETSSEILHSRLIPSHVKKVVWKRDGGRCVICTSKTNLHFDHDLPFSKGGSSFTEKNIRLLCLKCNLRKSDKIE